MLCPLCKKSDTKVLDSRDEETVVRRRRSCLKCSYRFTTFEKVEPPHLKVKKRNGDCEEYSRDKLAHGVTLAFEKRPFDCNQVEDIIRQIEEKIIHQHKKEISSKEIGDIVIDKLRSTDDVAYLRFVSVFKKFGSAKKFQQEVEKLGKSSNSWQAR